jgi:hypothetical protein
MPYSIKTDAADCKGYAVVDENGTTVACHTSRKAALDNQRALYANVPEATRKEEPTVSGVHVDSGMGRVRVKRPTFSKNVDVLIAQHYKLHNQTNSPSEAQLYVHHNILDEVQKAGMDCYCTCGNWSQPLVIDNVTTDLQTLQKSENPSLAPVKQIIQTGIDNGYKFADVLQMLDIGGYMMVVRPKEIQAPEQPASVNDGMSKSILSKIKDLLNKVGEPSLAGSVAEGGTATIVGEIRSLFKADEKRFTLGPWYIPDRADAHGEWTDTSELQNALWNYVKSGDRRIRLQHNKNVVAGEWVETMTWPYPVTVPITKADGSMGEYTYPTGTVFMGVQWEPWAWEMVKAGKLTGYSIGGKAERVLVDLPEEEVSKKKDLTDLTKYNPHHDASGRFASGGGGMGAGVASSILERVKANGGLSVNMVNGSEPTSGYMVAKGTEYGKTVSAEDFYDPQKGPKILADYMKENKADLGTGKNYLGLWHNTEDGKVYLDVSENILDKGAAITAGQSRDQISIWDVANFAEVQTGGTGVTKKEVGSRGNPDQHFNNDGR